jgi:hypothetical protein
MKKLKTKKTTGTYKWSAPKKKNPQDITLRNLRAMKKRIAILEAQVAHLLKHVHY